MGFIVHLGKSLLALALVRSGWLVRWHRRRAPHALVLAYHRVTPDAALAGCAYPAMHVSVSSFDAQLEALRQLYRVVSMGELRTLLAGDTPLREPVAAITFDDGYRDNFQHALPVLAKHGLPATFFLSFDFVDRGRGFWFDRLAAAVDAADADPVVRGRLMAALPPAVTDALAAGGARVERLRRAAAALKSLPDADRDAAVTAAMRATGLAPNFAASRRAGDGAAPPRVDGHAAIAPADADHAAPLLWDEIRAMQTAGMRIGAHGVRHGILTRMPPEAAAAEIRDSMAGIAARTGVAVQEFAYPNGDADDCVARAASAAGATLGFTMEPRAVAPGDDALRLGRRNVCEDTSRGAFGVFSRDYFWCEICGVFDRVLARGRRRS